MALQHLFSLMEIMSAPSWIGTVCALSVTLLAEMTGGIAFLYSKTKSNLDYINKNYLKATELLEDDELLILRLLRSHRFHTRSHIAKDIIIHWNKEKIHFSKIVPKAMEIINLDKIYNHQASYRMGVLLYE